MKVLFDEDVPHPLVRALRGHRVQTVAGMGWGGIENGELLKRLEMYGFDVFLTGDKNLPKQQDLSTRPFAVLVLSAINWTVIKHKLTTICMAIDAAQPGTIVTVECGVYIPRRNRWRSEFKS